MARTWKLCHVSAHRELDPDPYGTDRSSSRSDVDVVVEGSRSVVVDEGFTYHRRARRPPAENR